MKFAQLALLGLVAAQQVEDVEDFELEDMDLEDEDLDELIGERYPWRAVGPLMKQEWRIMETLGDMEDDFEKAEKKIEKGLRWAAKRYGPELKAWGESNIVKAKKVHDKMIEKSKYGQRIGHAFRVLAEDAMTSHWREGINQNGYEKWIKNEDATKLFEDLYEIKEAFKALITSKMATVNGKLGEATLKNQHFKNVVRMFMKDMGVKNMEELAMKLKMVGMHILKEMASCPKMQRLGKQVVRLAIMAERSKEVFDFDQKYFETWWNKHNFQPWI